METNEQRLRRIIDTIREHGGATTLHDDWVWLQEIQHERPAWAEATLKEVEQLYGQVAK